MTDIATQDRISAEEVPGLLVALVRLIAPQREGEVTLEQTLEQTLVGDLGYHSIALAELGFTIEDLFRFETLTPETAMSLERVGNIVELVGKHVADGTANLPEVTEVDTICARYGTGWPAAATAA